jgi:hypothetical protein
METLILWVGFVGAWLLFAGPIYQAALELQDDDIEFDRIQAAGAKVPKPPRASSWLWLLLPIKLYLEFKRNKQHQRQVIMVLSKEDIEAFMSFRSKATAWLFVALGGFWIAVKETYELAHHEEWGGAVLLVVIAGMFLLSLLNLVARIKRAEAVVNQ